MRVMWTNHDYANPDEAVGSVLSYAWRFSYMTEGELYGASMHKKRLQYIYMQVSARSIKATEKHLNITSVLMIVIIFVNSWEQLYSCITAPSTCLPRYLSLAYTMHVPCYMNKLNEHMIDNNILFMPIMNYTVPHGGWDISISNACIHYMNAGYIIL